MNRFDWIDFWSGITPDKVAAVDPSKDEKLSYALLNERGNRLSACLQQVYGLVKNDRIIVIASNCFEYLYLLAAAQKIGICIIPLNYRLTKNELSKLVEESEAKLILYQNDFEHLVGQFDYKFELKSFFYKVFDESKSTQFNPVLIDQNDPVLILFTSGSSGYPKGVKYTHKMMFWNSINTQISLVLSNETKTIICMPPFHTGGWNVLLTPVLHVGGMVIIMDKFDPQKVLDYIATYECQIFMGVPTMLQMMHDESCFDRVNLYSLKYIIVGGESMPVSLIEEYYKKGVLIRQGYGMTEVGPNLTSLHENYSLSKIGSIGKPNMYVDIRIVDENGFEVAPGQSGELLLNGPVVTPGYFNDQAQNKSAFDEDGWFKTGDVVYMDEDGFLYIVDRIKNMYISGGENVYPSEVERIIKGYAEVYDIVVVGVPDKKWGEVGYAFIISEKRNAGDIQAYCKEHLSKYKMPRYIDFVDMLPKTDSGKIDRKLLFKQALNKIGN